MEGTCIICGKKTPCHLTSMIGDVIPDKFICPDCDLKTAIGTEPTGVL